MSISLIIPCYNEASRLETDTFVQWVDESPERQLIFVNDGSRDDTGKLLDALAAERPHTIKAIHQPRNMGKAEAVRTGIQEAMAGDVTFVGYWDADLATPLPVVQQMLDHFGAHPNVDVVIGSRVKLMGRAIDRSAMRHYAGRIFATAASMTLRIPIYDTQCGAKLFRVCDALRDATKESFISGWVFDVELLARLLTHPSNRDREAEQWIHELPLPQWTDVAGSKVKLTDFPIAFWQLIKIRTRYGSGLCAR